MKPTQEQALDWAFECDFVESTPAEDVFSAIYVCCPKDIERLVILAYDAGQESMKWDGIHSCHPDCQRPACVHTRKAVEAEREACAKVCEELPADEFVERSEATIWDVATLDCAAAIRARREQ